MAVGTEYKKCNSAFHFFSRRSADPHMGLMRDKIPNYRLWSNCLKGCSGGNIYFDFPNVITTRRTSYSLLWANFYHLTSVFGYQSILFFALIPLIFITFDKHQREVNHDSAQCKWRLIRHLYLVTHACSTSVKNPWANITNKNDYYASLAASGLWMNVTTFSLSVSELSLWLSFG